jgi:hypothetical protein
MATSNFKSLPLQEEKKNLNWALVAHTCNPSYLAGSTSIAGRKKKNLNWALVVHTCNPSYLGGRDHKGLGSEAPQANNLRDSHPQNNQSKMTGGVAQAVECLLCK